LFFYFLVFLISSFLTVIYFVLFFLCFLLFIYLFTYWFRNLLLGTFFNDLPETGAAVGVGGGGTINYYE